MASPRLQVDRTALLVVDIQEKLLPQMHCADRLLPQAIRMVEGANVLGLPVLVTEQYPKGLGATVPQLVDRFSEDTCRYEKLKFSACISQVKDQLVQRGVRSVLVCGIEAHVCILHTCLDLIDAGFITAIVLDAIGSRRIDDQEAAVRRLTHLGVIPTTVESSLFEMVEEAGRDQFCAILPLIR